MSAEEGDPSLALRMTSLREMQISAEEGDPYIAMYVNRYPNLRFGRFIIAGAQDDILT